MILSNVIVICHDTLECVFSGYALVETKIQDKSLYTIYDYATSDALNIVDLTLQKNPDNKLLCSSVMLKVAGLQQGRQYVVTVPNTIRDATGTLITPTSVSKIITHRRTKVDSLIANIPKMYDKSFRSQLRAVLTAIGKEDDLIGGSQDELV